MSSRRTWDLWLLRAAWAYNRVRFRLLAAGLEGRAEFAPGCDVWAGSVIYHGAGKAFFGPGCVVERGPFPLLLEIEREAEVRLEPRVWFRGKYRPNVITCFEGARVSIGQDSLVNGAIISARESVTIGKKVMVSWNTAIIDSNLHPLANDQPLEPKPVTIGDYVMIAQGAILLPGSKIGSHSVVGAGSVVTGEIPSHVVAGGVPARVIREIGDRDRCL